MADVWSEFKFQIGDVVEHRSSGPLDQQRLVVLSLHIHKSQHGLERTYICRGLGSFGKSLVHAEFVEVELELSAKDS